MKKAVKASSGEESVCEGEDTKMWKQRKHEIENRKEKKERRGKKVQAEREKREGDGIQSRERREREKKRA